ncbi:MAG: N-acetyltransferase [Brevundimonas sp.]|nr:N-acetyltransferase [Brevundimonas sp.]
MASMTDPNDALLSFQEVLPSGILQLHNCELDADLRFHRDEPAPGVQRLTYVYTEGETVTALAMFVNVEPFQGRPCFMVGYAVPPAFRGRGLAKAVVRSALAEIRNGFGRARILPIYVEAVVAEPNLASRNVAEALISQTPTPITDEISGQPALQYLLKLEP